KRHVVVAEDAALRGVACIEERVARIVDDVVATGAERGEEGGSRGLCACDRLDTTAGPVREELAHAIGLARGTCEVACGVLDEQHVEHAILEALLEPLRDGQVVRGVAVSQTCLCGGEPWLLLGL